VRPTRVEVLDLVVWTPFVALALISRIKLAPLAPVPYGLIGAPVTTTMKP
jgi:hypothetical protein